MLPDSLTLAVYRQNPGNSQLRVSSVRSHLIYGRPDQPYPIQPLPVFSSDEPNYRLFYQTNMECRKRPLQASPGACDSSRTPKKRVSVVRPSDSDYLRWGVDEICQYLRREGLGEWEEAFRGCSHASFSSLSWPKYGRSDERRSVLRGCDAS